MKKTSLILLALITATVFIIPAFVFAQESAPEELAPQEPLPVYISFFYGDGCPHCHREALFLDKLENKYPEVDIKRFEVWNNQTNANLMAEVAKKLNFKHSGGVPMTVVGNQVMVGYYSDETTGARIEGIVKQHVTVGCVDVVGEIISSGESQVEGCQDEEKPEMIILPILGEVNIQNWSLPFLTIVIGAIDGFNPCAMWVLLFLISLLLGMEDRRKMWVLGSSFIIASAFVYFLFMSAWLNLFLFIGFISFVRIGIGIVAIASGGYHLREWRTNKEGVCKVAGSEKKQKIMEKFRRVTEQKSFWLALIGIISLAFAVNLIELICSAGLPAIYTQVLSLSNLSTPVYYLYLLLYIFIFMLDDLLVFIIAMTTLQLTGISTKYSRWANLIGGIVILVLGVLLIFKPGWIMFG